MLHVVALAALTNLLPHGPSGTVGRTGPVGNGLHAVAFVNDPLSHGTVGDNLLSLNEAIRLHNRVLQFSQLSPAEQNQISGFGLDVGWADIDESSTPVITVQQPLDAIVDMPHGFLIGGTNGRPVIDFTGTNSGFVAVSDFCNWRELVVRGGSWGIDLTQTNAVYGTQVVGVEFEQIATVGVRVRGNGAGLGRVLFDNCKFTAVPDAIVVDETAPDRSGFFYANRMRFLGGNSAITLSLGNGFSTVCQFDKLEASTLVSGVRILRPNGANRILALQAQYWDVESATGFECESLPGPLTTQLTMRMVQLRKRAPGNVVARFLPDSGSLLATLEEWTVDGSAVLACGTGSMDLDNPRMANGTVALRAGTTDCVRVELARLDSCALVADGTARARVDASCIVGGSVAATGAGSLLLGTTYVGAPVGGAVQQLQPVAAAQLGSMSLSPRNPQLGGTISLQADLPSGCFGLFAMGVTAEFPTLQSYPVHVYMEPATIYTFPGIYTGQQGTTLAVPNNLALLDTDWTAQVVVLPLPGSTAPALSLPPGQRFVLR